jgi:sialic acid synthase SpsE
MLEPHVPEYKIGSGDITWTEMLQHIARKGKPVLLATGAADLHDVIRAVDAILGVTPQLVLLQCNTNYTASPDNFDHINLRVLETFRTLYPGLLRGLSDHTLGHATVLGAVALGARVVEKHFTDDPGREGPDHAFSMTPRTWREMVDRTRELERALGTPVKRIEANEEQTVIVQRRCLRAVRDLPAGTRLSRDLLIPLRPAPAGSIPPSDIDRVVGLTLTRPLAEGAHVAWTLLSEG